jgi:hypothetical protein
MKKPVRKAGAMGPKPKATARTSKTAGDAQQYVRGNNPEERSKTISKASRNASSPVFAGLQAAARAEASRQIAGIVGKKAAKTNSSVKMYDKMEKDWSVLQKKQMKK